MIKLVNFTCTKSSLSRIGILNASHDNLVGNVIDLEKCNNDKYSLIKGKTNNMMSIIEINNNNKSSLTNLLKDIIKSPPNDSVLSLNKANIILSLYHYNIIKFYYYFFNIII
jgi:hypothetical protein